MKKNLFAILLIGLLFAVFGFAAWLNSVLIPFFQITLELSSFHTTLVTFSFFIAYVIMALPSAWLLQKIGFKAGLVTGLIIMAIGCLVFIPAAYERSFAVFLAGLFVMGSGQSLLQTAANPYITILGPIESAASRNSFMGICNKLAGIASQRLIGPVLLLNADAIINKVNTSSAIEKQNILNDMALRVVNPYWLMTASLIVIAIVVWLTKLPHIEETEINVSAEEETKDSIWLYPNLLFGVVALFCAEGLESITSYYIVPFGQSIGFSTEASLHFVDYIIYAMLAGYLFGLILIPKYLSQQKALSLCAALGICLCVAAHFGDRQIAIASIIGMGFCNSLNWPCIWPLSLKGVGKFTKTGSGLLIMGIAGGAILPIIFSELTSVVSARAGMLLLACLYVIILYFSLVASKKKEFKLKTRN